MANQSDESAETYETGCCVMLFFNFTWMCLIYSESEQLQVFQFHNVTIFFFLWVGKVLVLKHLILIESITIIKWTNSNLSFYQQTNQIN